MNDTVLTAGLITVLVALAKVIEIVVTKFVLNKKDDDHSDNETSSSILNSNGYKIDQVLAWQNVRDSNGVPMGYFPRTILETQEKIAESLRSCVVLQGKIVEELERMSIRFERDSEKMKQRFDEIEEEFQKVHSMLDGRR